MTEIPDQPNPLARRETARAVATLREALDSLPEPQRDQADAALTNLLTAITSEAADAVWRTLEHVMRDFHPDAP